MIDRLRAAWAALRGRPVVAHTTLVGGLHLAPGQSRAVITGNHVRP